MSIVYTGWLILIQSNILPKTETGRQRCFRKLYDIKGDKKRWQWLIGLDSGLKIMWGSLSIS